MMLPHQPQLTVCAPGAGTSGARDKSSARAAFDARRPMLGETRWWCDDLALTMGAGATGEAAGGGDGAAAPTAFPQSMQ
jgi:hypothetical protein